MIRPRHFPVFATPRLVLRELVRADVPQLFQIFSDPEVMRYWSTVPMSDPKEAETLVARTREQFEAGTGYRWSVTLKSDDRVIGTCSLFHLDEQNSRGEIGYALGRFAWGQGFMREALTGLITFAFGPMDLRRLEADTDPRNLSSMGLLARLGFAQEGLLRERWVVDGVVSDSALLGLLRSEWDARQAAGTK